MSEPIKRYDVDVKYIGSGEYLPSAPESADGEFVLYADHAAAVARVEKERDALKARVDRVGQAVQRYYDGYRDIMGDEAHYRRGADVLDDIRRELERDDAALETQP